MDAPYIVPVADKAQTPALAGTDALAALLLSASLFVLAGPYLVALGLIGVLATQALCFAMPALLVALTRPHGLAVLGTVKSSPRALLAALLLGVSLWHWNLLLVAPLGERFITSQEQLEWQSFVGLDSRSLASTLFFFALVPAVCEELLHRGVLAPSLARRLGTGPAVLASALLFGLSHLSLGRLLPTAVLGGAAAFLRLRTGSLLAAGILHFLYNSSILVMAYGGCSLPYVLLVPSLLLSALAFALVRRSPKSGDEAKGKANHTIARN